MFLTGGIVAEMHDPLIVSCSMTSIAHGQALCEWLLLQG